MSRMPDDAFDAAVRGLHADSLQALSPRVRAQLAQRRRLALAGAPSPARARLGWATAAASALVLVVALQVRPPLHPPAGDAALTAAPVREAPADTGGLLAEDPDLYLWLASGEAQAFAME
jgi:hypothetical protein